MSRSLDIEDIYFFYNYNIKDIWEEEEPSIDKHTRCDTIDSIYDFYLPILEMIVTYLTIFLFYIFFQLYFNILRSKFHNLFRMKNPSIFSVYEKAI